MSVTDTPIIVAQQLSFSYGEEAIVNNVSFEVFSGDYVGILGSNGSGKTTLIKLLVGLLVPTSGDITLFGRNPIDFREWDQVGYVPQHVFKNDQGFPATVEEIVASGLGRDERMLSEAEQRACIDRAIEATRVSRVRNRRIGELSGGEQQRAFIARALATRPKVLILDEPTTGIDREAEREFYALLEQLNSEGMTILLISHDLDAVAREVSKVLCLNRRLVYFGKPETLRRSTETLKDVYGDEKQVLFHAHEH